MPTRRQFLASGAIATALVGVSGLTLGLRATVVEEPVHPLQVLSRVEYSVLMAVAVRLCPGAAGLPGARELQVGHKVDALLAKLHPATGAEVKDLLMLFENALVGLFLDGRVTTFTGASLRTQDRVLDNWRTSRLLVRRQGFQALAGLINASYWSDPAVYAFVGYPGPPALGRQ
jgi:hypothetical protein